MNFVFAFSLTILEIVMSSSKTPYLDSLDIRISDLLDPAIEMKRLPLSTCTVGVFREIYVAFNSKLNMNNLMLRFQGIVPEEFKNNFAPENHKLFRNHILKLINKTPSRGRSRADHLNAPFDVFTF